MLAENVKKLDSEEMKKLSESFEEDNEEIPKKLTPKEMEEFFQRNKSKKQRFPKITDMAAWKKKHWLDPSTKVFIVHGGYGSIKNSLLERGWFWNKDSKSPCYDLKWVLRAKDVNHKTLEDH